MPKKTINTRLTPAHDVTRKLSGELFSWTPQWVGWCRVWDHPRRAKLHIFNNNGFIFTSRWLAEITVGSEGAQLRWGLPQGGKGKRGPLSFVIRPICLSSGRFPSPASQLLALSSAHVCPLTDGAHAADTVLHRLQPSVMKCVHFTNACTSRHYLSFCFCVEMLSPPRPQRDSLLLAWFWLSVWQVILLERCLQTFVQLSAGTPPQKQTLKCSFMTEESASQEPFVVLSAN